MNYRVGMINRPRRLPLTDEDRAAWYDWQVNHARNWCLWSSLEHMSRTADRRDAAMMLELAELRWLGAYKDVRHLQAWAGQDGFSMGGWMGYYRWESPNWSDGTPRKEIRDL